MPEIQCDRCEEFAPLHCHHGFTLCPSCAASWCESCEAEEADALAIVEEQRKEWWAE